ncbi:hypothetical protein MMC10_006068 [Thelotrema lepadinum]|nr:hypothetical protein [Thelotrema lepadinum]
MCCSGRARARKQARKQARRAALLALVQHITGSKSHDKAIAPYPNTNGPMTYGTTRGIEEGLPAYNMASGDARDVRDDTRRLTVREPPTYGEVMGEGKVDINEKAGR